MGIQLYFLAANTEIYYDFLYWVSALTLEWLSDIEVKFWYLLTYLFTTHDFDTYWSILFTSPYDGWTFTGSQIIWDW